MRKLLNRWPQLVVAMVLFTGCGGGDQPQATKEDGSKKPEKPAKADVPKDPAKGAAKGTGKAGTKANATAPAKVAAKVRKPFTGERPGTLTIRGDSKFVETAQKIAANSEIFKKVMSLRKSGKRSPALLIEVTGEEGLAKKFLEGLAAKGVDTGALKGPKVAREMAKESGTAVLILTIEASEGTDKDNKVLATEPWEAEAPVPGDDPAARTDKDLDAAYKEAEVKAATEVMVMAMDSMALTLIQREGISARDVLPELRLLRNDPNETIKKKAVEVCDQIAAAIRAQALEAVKSNDTNARKRGLEDLLAQEKLPDDDLGIVLELMKDPEYEVRSTSALALMRLKPDTEGLAQVLCEALGDRSSEVRTGAQEGLLQLGPVTAPLLLAKLTDRTMGKQAQRTLEALGEKEPQAVADMGKALSGEDADAKTAILTILGRLGPKTAPAVKALIAVVEGTDKRHRSMAADALGRVGCDAEEAIPALEKAAADGIRAAYDARRAILLAMRDAGKKLPESASYEVGKPETKKEETPVAPPPPKIVKRKVLVLKDGTEVPVSSFMKVGGEYHAKTLDGESKVIPEANVKEVKVVEVEESKP